MILWHLLLAFFLANVLGYGGGPASIPFMYQEVVTHFNWISDDQFSNMLALGNMLPGPIATKIAIYVGYDQAGWLGSVAALAATTVPSAVVLILLLKVLHKHRTSKAVKGMTLLVQPIIAAMMLQLTWKTGLLSFHALGILQTVVLFAFALLALVKFRIHPALVICGALAYGGLVLPYIK
ncbi:chromate transporter [Paenibacillus sp. R14(2021)]|uniref:chromate transporter n=1 Tax=Paenibacillus sp. R14(2021) TaxID=2859228 RepID=UPI001C6144E1|nr:chromate transporter [Paenibacillus sp. R14(2021)]